MAVESLPLLKVEPVQSLLKPIAMEEEQPPMATLDEQFREFSRLFDRNKVGETMTLYLSDYWMRQAKIIDDRRVTMTDTGVAWWKFCKSELNFEEWYDFLSDLCNEMGLDQTEVEISLTNCGEPGNVPVVVPEYKKFFDTYKPKHQLINKPEE